MYVSHISVSGNGTLINNTNTLKFKVYHQINIKNDYIRNLKISISINLFFFFFSHSNTYKP